VRVYLAAAEEGYSPRGGGGRRAREHPPPSRADTGRRLPSRSLFSQVSLCGSSDSFLRFPLGVMSSDLRSGSGCAQTVGEDDGRLPLQDPPVSASPSAESFKCGPTDLAFSVWNGLGVQFSSGFLKSDARVSIRKEGLPCF
jgi:hypothetical protein